MIPFNSRGLSFIPLTFFCKVPFALRSGFSGQLSGCNFMPHIRLHHLPCINTTPAVSPTVEAGSSESQIFPFKTNNLPVIAQLYALSLSFQQIKDICSLSALLQVTRVLHVSRRWTRVPPAPVTITGHATPRAPALWGLDVAAQQGSQGPPAPSWWTSVP